MRDLLFVLIALLTPVVGCSQSSPAPVSHPSSSAPVVAPPPATSSPLPDQTASANPVPRGDRVADEFATLQASIESMDGSVKQNENGDVISVALVGTRSRQFSDQDLQRLAAFRQIELLNLSGCEKLTDDSLRHLARFPALKTLFLNPQIGDMGLGHLGKLTNLRKLYVLDCDVTDTAVGRLQLALPDCEVKR